MSACLTCALPPAFSLSLHTSPCASLCEKWKVLKCFPLFCVNAKHNCPTTTKTTAQLETKTETMTKTITMTMTSERCQLFFALLPFLPPALQ